MRKFTLLGATIAVLAFLAVPASSFAGTVKLFEGNGGDASWQTVTPTPPGDGDKKSIRLVIPDADAFAGAVIQNVPSAPPANPPSYDFMSNVASPASGGSPRLRIFFADGGSGDLRPLAWASNVWQHIDGSTNNWDNNGGSCGFQFQVSYAQVLACHAGSAVVGAHVVTDSGWVVSPYTHYIDNIQYGNALISHPRGLLGTVVCVVRALPVLPPDPCDP